MVAPGSQLYCPIWYKSNVFVSELIGEHPEACHRLLLDHSHGGSITCKLPLRQQKGLAA